MFGTPVDAENVAVRTAPETVLRFLPADSPDRSQAVLATPRMWPALDVADLRGFTNFFDGWLEGSGWWRTVRPAVFALERVTTATWAGRLIERGALIRVTDDLAFEPPIDTPGFFVTTREEAGPLDLVSGAPAVYESPAMEIRLARRRRTTANLWARTFVGGEDRPVRRALLAQEIQVMQLLCGAGLAPGYLETFHRDGSLVVNPIEGLAPTLLLKQASMSQRGEILNVCRRLFIEAAKLAHRSNACLGPVALDCLRLRWLPSVEFAFPSGALIALPGAGRAREGTPPSVMDLFPPSEHARIERQFESPYVRSAKQDLAGITDMMRAARGEYSVA